MGDFLDEWSLSASSSSKCNLDDVIILHKEVGKIKTVHNKVEEMKAVGFCWKK